MNCAHKLSVALMESSARKMSLPPTYGQIPLREAPFCSPILEIISHLFNITRYKSNKSISENEQPVENARLK